MITEDKIKRINALAKKLKEEGLTPEEQAERKQLHKEYVSAIRGQVKGHLSRVKYVEDLTEEEKREYLNTSKH
ncbi:MAG: DUF896 domain-containing protein [Eubacteriales bacterium]|nr:DUF896 domain-containing protein [Eubacteriales bacterium]MDY3332959.1 DUF896 domain-containing protein [Gallibacter sp.]